MYLISNCCDCIISTFRILHINICYYLMFHNYLKFGSKRKAGCNQSHPSNAPRKELELDMFGALGRTPTYIIKAVVRMRRKEHTS